MFGSSGFKVTFVATMLWASALQPALAGSAPGLARTARVAPPSQYIVATKHVLAPFAFVKFCRNNQQDCQPSAGKTLMALDTARHKELLRVNAMVNRTIKARNDNTSNDVWSADVAAGDCEDFALTKRRMLIRAGWPAPSLRLAVARTGTGEGHAVLVVKTSRGDLVLDNRSNRIRRWNQTDLTWEKIQSDKNPRLWLAI